jgi:hypothetical protein
MSFMNGGSQMPMMMSSSASFCLLALAGAGAFWYINSNNNKNKDKDEDETGSTPEVDIPVAPPASLQATTYRVSDMGSLGLDASCSDSNAMMRDKKDYNQQQWKVVPVEGKTNVYNLLSNERVMSGCPAFLTASSTCNGTSLESPQYLDRQEYEIFDVNGTKQIRNVACKNKNLPSYIQGRKNAGVTFSRKTGTSFMFDPVA